MQEDKEAVFDCVDTVKMCLRVFTPMIAAMKACTCNMYRAAQRGFLNATDLADYLTKKGLPFRAAYKITGVLVAYCIEHTTSRSCRSRCSGSTASGSTRTFTPPSRSPTA